MPTSSAGGGGYNPLGRSRGTPAPGASADGDGWGEDAPQVTRSQLEKVAPAYKPTKVNMAELTGQKQEPSRFQPRQDQENSASGDVVRGGYQPIGKVDIAAIRRQAQEQGNKNDDRPAIVKGSYEPTGKVDIAAIRAKANAGPSAASPAPVTQSFTGASQQSDDQDAAPKSLAERSAAFSASERLTSLPKPKVANRFGSATSKFAGTKPPAPGGFGSKPLAAAAPVGTADKNFAAQGGKTPAQLWAERKARERGNSAAAETTPPSSSAGFNAPASPISSQPSGGWQSGYAGKKWGGVATNRTGTSNISAQKTGQDEPQERAASPPAGGVNAIRDRFKNAAPIGVAAGAGVGAAVGAASLAVHDNEEEEEEEEEQSAPHPPPMDFSSKPNAGVALPGLPSRPVPAAAEEDHPAEEHVDLPPPPPQPRSPSPEPDDDYAPSSPVRIAMPVARTAEPTPLSPSNEQFSPSAVPEASISDAVDSHRQAPPEPQIQAHDPARIAAQNVAGAGAATANPGAGVGGKRALIQYDYEKAEDNEIELREGDYVINIEMVDEDWWMGQNSEGESGLFPSNYVELIEDDDDDDNSGAVAASGPPPPLLQVHEPEPAAPTSAGGKTATAQYEYEAAEDNELSFPDGATITNVVSLAFQR